MTIPITMTMRNVSLSPVAKKVIHDRAEKLGKYYKRITGCRLMIEAPHRHHHRGVLYYVRVDLTVPGGEIVVKKEAHEDLYVAIRKAFSAARRQLEDYARRRRGHVKNHVMVPAARVTKLFPREGYGFLETSDGREIYFHKNSVLNPGFGRIELGEEVHFSEEQGDRGPQASTVSPLSRKH